MIRLDGLRPKRINQDHPCKLWQASGSSLIDKIVR